jgi:hypothetical protein
MTKSRLLMPLWNGQNYSKRRAWLIGSQNQRIDEIHRDSEQDPQERGKKESADDFAYGVLSEK